MQQVLIALLFEKDDLSRRQEVCVTHFSRTRQFIDCGVSNHMSASL
jgi:hypothetical protein